MSLRKILPTPKNTVWDREDTRNSAKSEATKVGVPVSSKITAPPYGQRKDWMPRTEPEYGDGSPFPEIHKALYPLGLGAPENMGSKSKSLPIRVDDKGKVKNNNIARQGHGKDKKVYSSISQVQPAEVLAEDDKNQRCPDKETVAKTTEQIRMVEAQPDPLEPPKFRINKKIPRGPPSPPAPLLHSPSRKVSVKEQMEWKIPPCTSNWKNAKGYTIPLDSEEAEARRRTDLRAEQHRERQRELSLQRFKMRRERERDITENIALGLPTQRGQGNREAFFDLRAGLRNLQAAEFSGVEEAEARRRTDLRAKQRRERQRELHLQRFKMRRERERDITEKIALGLPTQRGQGNREAFFDQRAGLRNLQAAEFSGVEEAEARRRTDLRAEQHRERQRELSLQRFKRRRERERDITEKISLGLSAQRGQGNGEALFDQRLFNTSKGMDSGYGNDEAYNVYDKPWRDSNPICAHIYPSKHPDSDNLDATVKAKRFVPDKQFSGATSQRCGPVEFEKDEDPIGLDLFLKLAKKATKRTVEKISEPSSHPEGQSKRSRRK